MDAHDLRGMAQRCRDLYQEAVEPEVKAQLLEWIDDFESEAAAAENSGGIARTGRTGSE
jgi:type VI protein secretion system component VasF